MSAIICHGFEESTTVTDFFTGGGGGSITSAAARTGSQSMGVGSGSNVQYTVPATLEHATLIWGVAVYRNVNSVTHELQLWSDTNATQHGTLTIRGDGAVDYRRGSTSGTQLGSSLVAGTVPFQTWTHIGLQVKLSDTVGTVDVWINGVLSAISLTNQDTKNGGTKTVFDSIRFVSGGTLQQGTYFDDFYLLNGDATTPNSFLGDKKVLTSMPNGNGATNNFTSSSGGANYTNVDEKPRNTSDYNYDTVNGDIDLYDVENLAAGTQNISFVQVELYADRSDAGTTMNFQRACRSGGSNFFGPSIVLGTSFTYLLESGVRIILVNDPNTAAAWTVANFNAAQWGVKLITP